MVGLLTNFLQEQRLRRVLPFVRGMVLDLGCSDAPMVDMLRATSGYVGVDSRPEAVEGNLRRHPGLRFYCRDLDRDRLDFGERFDTILLSAVIEHLSRPEFLLAQIPALLAPGGRLVLTTPTPLGNTIHHAGAQVGLFSQAAADEHKFLFTQASLSALLTSAGLEMVLYQRFLLGQNQLCVAQAGR